MDTPRKEAGNQAEDNALAYLKQFGLKLVQRNFRCKAGEIDLIMLDGKTLALIEVRYRSSTRYGGAAASVTWHKQQRLINAARYLMVTRADLRRYPARFDVIAISSLARDRVEWIKGAFEM